MADEVKDEQDVEISDDELAILANKEIKKRDEEIRKLKLELNKAKLLSTAEDEKEEELSVKDCRTAMYDNHVNMYDYAKACVGIIEDAQSRGIQDAFGEDTENLRQFFSDVINACYGDKSKFIPFYQASLGPDDKQVSAAYGKRK